MNPGSVFISHSSRQPDFEVTERLVDKLEEAGSRYGGTRKSLEAGQMFPVEILEAIALRPY